MKNSEINLAHVTYSDDAKAQLELHSFLNIINVVNMQLSVLEMEIDSADQLDWIKERTLQIAEKVKNGDSSTLYPNHIDQYCSTVISELERIVQSSDAATASKVSETTDLMNDFFSVLRVRSNELLEKILYPGKWESFNIDDYKNEFDSFFMAVEKNSRGKYRIIYNIARQEEMDYLVQLDIESEFGNHIYLPLSLKDVIRDLVANARKYTPVGGQIDIGIYQDKTMFRFSVQDNGIGIPEDELEKVFELGYRASNVVSRPTMGGGFGLTKAAHVTKQLNGRLFIASKEGSGTRIKIEVPIPKHVIHHIETHV